MTQDDLVERFAIRGYTKKAARIIIKDVVGIIEEALAVGESVTLPGLGTFDVRQHKDKGMRDINTGELRIIPSHPAPRFTAGNRLRRICKQGYVDGV